MKYVKYINTTVKMKINWQYATNSDNLHQHDLDSNHHTTLSQSYLKDILWVLWHTRYEPIEPCSSKL